MNGRQAEIQFSRFLSCVCVFGAFPDLRAKMRVFVRVEGCLEISCRYCLWD